MDTIGLSPLPLPTPLEPKPPATFDPADVPGRELLRLSSEVDPDAGATEPPEPVRETTEPEAMLSGLTPIAVAVAACCPCVAVKDDDDRAEPN